MKTKLFAATLALSTIVSVPAFSQTDNQSKSTAQPVTYTLPETISFKEWTKVTPVVEEIVDLGLSVEWGTLNIGADKPWMTGEYFNLDKETAQKIIRERLGEGWRLPTQAECQELLDKCTLTRHDFTVTGLKDFDKNQLESSTWVSHVDIFTAPNGARLILPSNERKRIKNYRGEILNHWENIPIHVVIPVKETKTIPVFGKKLIEHLTFEPDLSRKDKFTETQKETYLYNIRPVRDKKIEVKKPKTRKTRR